MKIILCKDSADGRKHVGIAGAIWIHNDTSLNSAISGIVHGEHVSGMISHRFHENPQWQQICKAIFYAMRMGGQETKAFKHACFEYEKRIKGER